MSGQQLVAHCSLPRALSNSCLVKVWLSIILSSTAMTRSCLVGAIRTNCRSGVVMNPNQVLERAMAVFFQLKGHPEATRNRRMALVSGQVICEGASRNHPQRQNPSPPWGRHGIKGEAKRRQGAPVTPAASGCRGGSQ